MPIKLAYVLDYQRYIAIEIDQNQEDRQAAFTAVQRLFAE